MNQERKYKISQTVVEKLIAVAAISEKVGSSLAMCMKAEDAKRKKFIL